MSEFELDTATELCEDACELKAEERLAELAEERLAELAEERLAELAEERLAELAEAVCTDELASVETTLEAQTNARRLCKVVYRSSILEE
jgi:hypothetical protein